MPCADDNCSGWRRDSTSSEAAKRPNARRVPPAQQDSLPAKLARERQQRPAHGALLAVRPPCDRMAICACPDEPRYRYPNLYEVRLIPTKKDIAFVEFLDEASATVAKDALHNYKLDGENKIKVRATAHISERLLMHSSAPDHLRAQVIRLLVTPDTAAKVSLSQTCSRTLLPPVFLRAVAVYYMGFLVHTCLPEQPSCCASHHPLERGSIQSMQSDPASKRIYTRKAV